MFCCVDEVLCWKFCAVFMMVASEGQRALVGGADWGVTQARRFVRGMRGAGA